MLAFIFPKRLEPIASMGLVYLPYIYHKNSTIHVGKYTIPMDGMGEAP